MGAAGSSAQSEKPDVMQKYWCTGVLWTVVLVEYGERWCGTGQRCQILSVGWRRTGAGREEPAATWS